MHGYEEHDWNWWREKEREEYTEWDDDDQVSQWFRGMFSVWEKRGEIEERGEEKEERVSENKESESRWKEKEKLKRVRRRR